MHRLEAALHRLEAALLHFAAITQTLVSALGSKRTNDSFQGKRRWFKMNRKHKPWKE
jgi:hypothetical protein